MSDHNSTSAVQNLNEIRLESLLNIAQREFSSRQELLDYTLEESIRMTGSRIGYIYYYDEQTRLFELNSWSREVMRECSIANPQSCYELDKTGLWGETVRQRRPIIVNDFQAEHLLKKGYPPGHAPLFRFLTLPIFNSGRIVAVVGVANKAEDYDETDVRQLTLMMDAVWKIVEQQRSIGLLRESEQRFRLLFEKMTEGVALHRLVYNDSGDPSDYLIIDVNPAYEQILGISRGRVVGQLASIAYKESPPPFLERFSKVVASGQSLKYELFYQPLNMHLDVTVVPWEQNGFATIFSDITERKKHNEEIHKALGFVETLLKSSPMGIRVFDGENGRCIQANQAAADIAGSTIEQLIGQNFRELPSWHEAGLTGIAEQVLADGIPRPIETDLHTTFGRRVTARYYLSRFVADGKAHLLVLGRDVTEEKRLEEENRRIEEQMLHVQKLESLGVLAGGIAHDFNNILMAIMGNAELASLQLPPGSPVAANLREIESAARRASELSHQMLAYSGKGHFLIKPQDINLIICEIAILLDVSVSKKASLHLELQHNLPPVMVDTAQISQVIMNLIINASEALEDSTGDITISTGTMYCDESMLARAWVMDNLPEGDYVYMKIADTGCGMDQDTVSKIFEPFFTTKFTGRGLGMSAVIGIVRGHRGAIMVESQKGQGATFTILLPPATEATETCVENKRDAESEGLLKAEGIVLLVDDEESIRHMGQAMLELFGFQALTAADGFSALELYNQYKGQITCVILDLTMPHMDGEQTFRELRKIDPNAHVIVSSGYTEQEISGRFASKGLAGFIQKPYQIQEMEKVLKKVLQE
ncbi:MAG TPA: GAF domain-containing protein [Deltaproteobacteria bacterium]|nr:GAF domain-containing protein [Deltaproteobacteria bacterium]